MKTFLTKHAAKIIGTLSCFDRLIFKGHLMSLNHPKGMEEFFRYHGILFKNLKHFLTEQAQQIKARAEEFAARHARPFQYLSGRSRKEDLARRIAAQDGIDHGLVCVLSALEPCRSFKLAYGAGRPKIVAADRKCLFFYFYFVDREFGFMHVRIQSWFPFTLQVYVNGHEWLARRLERTGIGHVRHDNAFFEIADIAWAQRLADRLAQKNLVPFLDALARRVNPLLRGILRDLSYYWVTDQAEYSTDVLFQNRAQLAPLYEKLLRHATLAFGAEDVLRFLGRKLHGAFAGEILNDCKKRWPGARVKHRVKENWIKMYDKAGRVLRVETVINHPYEFKVRRRGKRKGREVVDWFPLSKGVAYLPGFARVAQQANQRYLEALAQVDDPTQAYRELDALTGPAPYRDKKRRGLNPLQTRDRKLFAAVMRGEHLIHGFRQRDIACRLGWKIPADTKEKLRQSARLSRCLQLLHAHRLIAKIPRSRRWRVTTLGHRLMASSLWFFKDDFPSAFHRLAS